MQSEQPQPARDRFGESYDEYREAVKKQILAPEDESCKQKAEELLEICASLYLQVVDDPENKKCKVCKKQDGTKPCNGCGAVFYCSDTCFSQDNCNHFDPCAQIQLAIQKVTDKDWFEKMDERRLTASIIREAIKVDITKTQSGKVVGMAERSDVRTDLVMLPDEEGAPPPDLVLVPGHAAAFIWDI